MIKSEQCFKGFDSILNRIPDENSIGIHGSYRFPVYPGWKAGIQDYTNLHILYVTGGKGAYHILDGSEIPLSHGSLVIITPGIKHYATVDEYCPLCISGFRFGLYDRKGCHVTKEVVTPFYSYTQVEDTYQMDRFTGNVHNVFHHSGTKAARLYVLSCILQMLAMLCMNFKEKKKLKLCDRRMEAAKQMIELSVFSKMTLGQISDKLGITPRYLQKKFKSLYGFSPKEYYLQNLMNQSYKMLSQKGMSVRDVSEAVGYSDQYAFSRQFKKHFKIPPSAVMK